MTDQPPAQAAEESTDQELPERVVSEVERLTRLAREAVDDAEREAYLTERAAILEEENFRARVREDNRPVLVCYPAEWVEDGTVDVEHVEDTDRAIERPLDGETTGADWATVHERNEAIAERVAAEHGPDHGENVRIFGAYMSNHHEKSLTDATESEVRQFLTDFYPRNAWPTDHQKEIVEASIRRAFDCAGKTPPQDS